MSFPAAMASQKTKKLEQSGMTAEESRKDTSKKLTICVSSRSLLYLEKEFKVYEEKGLDEYIKAMKKREEEPFLDRGAAFPFIHALLEINRKLENPPFDIVLLSNNNAQAGAALTYALRKHNLNIEKIFLTSRDSVIQYLGAFGPVLYLSAKERDVIEAHRAGYASLQVEPEITSEKTDGDEKLNVTFGARFIRFGDPKDEGSRHKVSDNCCLQKIVNIFEEIIGELNPEETSITFHRVWPDGECDVCRDSRENEKEERLASANDNVNVPPVKPERNKQPIPDVNKAITVCISSRSLFNLEKEYRIFKQNSPNLERYTEAMQKREKRPFEPGIAFPFIDALLAVNKKLLLQNPKEKVLFDVVMMSHNGAQQGIALINSINHHKLAIERICLTAGSNVIGYLKAFKTNLFLSADKVSVNGALDEGIAAARIYAGLGKGIKSDQLRVAFDGGAVLYKNEAGETRAKLGASKHYDFEFENADKPLQEGPLKEFAKELGDMKKKFSGDCPIRTYLVTQRLGATTGARVILTFREWGLDIDEVFFLGQMPKDPILEKIEPHIFFDDRKKNLSGLVPGGHVPT